MALAQREQLTGIHMQQGPRNLKRNLPELKECGEKMNKLSSKLKVMWLDLSVAPPPSSLQDGLHG